jgi:LuxR family maltose regulon positive regulatory protein
MKARIWVAQGKLTKALEWVREQGLSVDDAPSYLREFEHVTLARVLIARYKSDRETGSIHEAIGLLERLLHAAEEGGRMGSVIEILALLALAHQAQGNITTALVPLERALTLAEPEGYVRIFVDEGEPMAELLTRMKDESGRMKEYIHKLLAAFGNTNEFHPSHLHFAQAQVSFILQPLIEPLSENELEVLRLLRTELSGPEIARQRMVSLSTIRTHTQHIYAKLGVNNRRAAVRRAEELGLL